MNKHLRQSSWIFDIGMREMRADQPPGWGAHMAVFSALGVIMMSATLVGGPPLEWPLGIVGAVDLAVTRRFVRRSLRRIRRMGISGPSRARWWIELSALEWTLCMSCGVFCLINGRAAAALPKWMQLSVTVAATCTGYLFGAFVASTVVGYFLGLVQVKRMSGRSLELINFFFWTIVVILAALQLPDDPALGEPTAIASLVLAGIVICIVGVLAARERLAGGDGKDGMSDLSPD